MVSMWVPRMMGRVDRRVLTKGRLWSVYSDGGRRSLEKKIKK